MSRVYLSGPMTGIPEFNYPEFNRVAAFLRAAGHDVINPAENHGGDTTLPYADYLRRDVEHLLTVEAVAVLPGWERSRGARLEVGIAHALDLNVFNALNGEPVEYVPSAPTDQPPPIPNDGAPVWDLVVADMQERDHIGRERYGTPLQTNNGRDALVDAYQEALDLVVYLRQAIAERAA